MRPLLFSAMIWLGLFMQTSIYDFEITGADNTAIDFDGFRHKKILLVNIATGSEHVAQLAELQQLKQQYGDSVTIIVFPSNSFGHENRTSAEVRDFCQSQYSVDYLIASNGEVTGDERQPVYQWLTKLSENGIADTEVKDDFQKYIIDSKGELLGIFAGSVSPISSPIVNTILGIQN